MIQCVASSWGLPCPSNAPKLLLRTSMARTLNIADFDALPAADQVRVVTQI